MRALRVVGVTGDGAVVLEDPGRRERYTVPADEQLRAAARGDVTRLGQIAIELESQLRPREIQARIRGGASVEQVASAAGVPVQKIERFAYPVLLERSRTAELAQGAHPQRTDGADVRTLGETVAHTFGLRGQDYTDAGWDSWKGEDGKWVVALSWQAGRSDNAAHWAFQPGAHGGTVVALDEHASDLIEGLPARPLRPLGPVIDIARDEEQEPAPEPGTAHVRAATAGDARVASGDPRPARGGIAPEQRRSSPPPPAHDTRRRETDDQPADEPTRGPSAYAGSPPASRPAEQPRPADDVSPAPSTTAAEPAAAAEPVTAEPGQAVAEPGTVEKTGADAAPEPESTEPATAEPDTTGPAAADADATETATAPAATGISPASEQPTPPAAAVESTEDTGSGADTPDEATGSGTDAATPAANGARPAARARTKTGKPVMPSGDEVLLGVRGQR